jgi:hypothetical protein
MVDTVDMREGAGGRIVGSETTPMYMLGGVKRVGVKGCLGLGFINLEFMLGFEFIFTIIERDDIYVYLHRHCPQ